MTDQIQQDPRQEERDLVSPGAWWADLSPLTRFTVVGFLFGLVFPVAATLFDLLLSGFPVTFENVVRVQREQPLHFIIDTAPAVLAVAGWLTGRAQIQVLKIGTEMEERVSERTAELEANTARMQAVAELGGRITQARELDVLLSDVVQVILDRFDFYHAQVFLIEESGRYAVLQASTGDAGRELLARGHRLEVGSRSVIGQVTARGEPVIALDTDADVVHRVNELLPLTRSEMALPLRIGGRILGALDVQSVEARAFTDADTPIFQTMADQLAIAIDNVRLLEDARRNLQDIEALNRQLTGEAWVDYVAGQDGGTAGYVADDRGLRPAGADDGDSEALTMPLSIRGQQIGSLDIKSRDGKELDDEVQSILEAVAERVALALDNTRLSQQAQRTAQRQQLLNVFSEQLQRASDIEGILRAVATEISEIMQAPRAFIQLETRGEEEQDN